MNSKIVLLGPINPVGVTFSGQAYPKLAKAFGAPKIGKGEKNVIAVEKNEHILDTMLYHEKSYGIIAMETSTKGRVTANVESFIRFFGRWNDPSACSINVIGAIRMQIHFALMAMHEAQEKTEEIIAHKEAFVACDEAIRRIEHDKRIVIKRTELTTSNGKAAEMVVEKNGRGIFALAPIAAAKKYGLEVYDDQFETGQRFTTFFLLGPRTRREIKGKVYRVLITFELPNVSGALFQALAPFQQEDINLIEIHSMAVESENYHFALEAECGARDFAYLENALRKFKVDVKKSIVFGPFPVIEG